MRPSSEGHVPGLFVQVPGLSVRVQNRVPGLSVCLGSGQGSGLSVCPSGFRTGSGSVPEASGQGSGLSVLQGSGLGSGFEACSRPSL